MAESRRARRLLEAQEAQEAKEAQESRTALYRSSTSAASPYVIASVPYDVSTYASSPPEPVAVPAPAPLPEPVAAPEPGPGTHHAEAPDLLRGEGRRISVASESHGARRALQVATLPGLGCLLLLWALTTLVGDVRWGPFSVLPVAFACLSPLTVIPAVPLALVAIQRRRWAALMPALAAAGLPWFFVIGYVFPADYPAGPTVPLRAMLVTAHDGRADAKNIADAVRSQRVDLLVVTELSPALAHDLALAGLPESLTPRYVSVPDPGVSPAAGIGIYSRFDVGKVTTPGTTHWPAVSVPVTVGRTTITLVAGHAVQPSTNHLDRWQHDLAGFGSAAGAVKGPLLLLGNLNATPWNPQFRRLASGRLHDAADVLGQGLRPTWPNWSPLPLLPTDHALVSGLGVTDSSALQIGGSDHRALSVGLLVPTR